MIFRIAFKNIWRNKARSLIVITAVTLGLTGGLIVVAVMTGLVDQKSSGQSFNTEVSHIQIHDSSYLKELRTPFRNH